MNKTKELLSSFNEALEENEKLKLKNALLLEEMENLKRIASSYDNMGVELEDLLQESYIEFVDSIDSFNNEEDFNSYYEKRIIKRLEELIEEEKAYKTEAIELASKLNRLIEKEKILIQNLKRKPSHLEIMMAMRMTDEEYKALRDLAFELILEDETIKNKEEMLISELIDLKQNKEEDEVEDFKNKELVDDSLSVLNDREKNVIQLLFGLDGNTPLSVDEVAKLYHVSSERIKQVRDLAIRKMKEVNNG